MSAALVAIEGPNGVGKTTIARELADLLSRRWSVTLTTEPTRTPLGNLARTAEADIHGRAYALLLAADRHVHVEHEIVPQLAAGGIVITDRYVQSSLVLQRIDGLSLEEIWSYNQHIPPADLSVYLDEDPTVIEARLRADRGGLTRLERIGSALREIELYADARAFLGHLGWSQVSIDCRGRAPAAIADTVATHVAMAVGDG